MSHNAKKKKFDELTVPFVLAFLLLGGIIGHHLLSRGERQGTPLATDSALISGRIHSQHSVHGSLFIELEGGTPYELVAQVADYGGDADLITFVRNGDSVWKARFGDSIFIYRDGITHAWGLYKRR